MCGFTCFCMMCPLLCISGQTSCFNKAFVRCVQVCAAVPGSYLLLFAGFPVSLAPAVRLARAPASVRTSPSDLCAVPGDLWVVCTRCLSALASASPHVREHVSRRVHAPCARRPRVCAGRCALRPEDRARFHAPRVPPPPRPPAPQRAPRLAARSSSRHLLPRPARPRSPLSPAVPARPRRAALRSHWLRAPLCGGSCGPSAFECREGPGREPFHGPSVSPPAAAPPPAPRAPPPAPAAPAAPPPAPRSRATKGPRAAAAAARGARMVLVHVGYLVLPVFGSVRNRGIAFSFRGLLLSERGSPQALGGGGGGGEGGRGGRAGAQAQPRGEANGAAPHPFLGRPPSVGWHPRGSFCSEVRVW
jgi:hypothetical protein